MTESRQTIVHETDEGAAVARIRDLAATLGLDPKKLLGSVGVVDAEFIEVTEVTKPGEGGATAGPAPGIGGTVAAIAPGGNTTGMEDML